MCDRIIGCDIMRKDTNRVRVISAIYAIKRHRHKKVSLRRSNRQMEKKSRNLQIPSHRKFTDFY